jgi:signal transduction histidine kinase
VEVNALLGEAADMILFDPRFRGVEIRHNFAQNLRPVAAVPDQLMQVFVNLLLNAAEAVDPQRGKVECITRNLPDGVRIVIQDNGRGIPGEHLEKVFEPFFTTKPSGEGTGLGLWVSRGIIEQLGGTLEVSSQPDKFTRFTIFCRSSPWRGFSWLTMKRFSGKHWWSI